MEQSPPIAVVGMSCRFPGAPTTSAFWDVLIGGADVLGDAPAGRPPTASRAGYLPDVAGFDAGLFGISPREARELDPQQRLLLELCWEAFEDAGTAPDSWHDSATGVFVGVTAEDYALLAARRGAEVGHHRLTGTSRAIIANRLSHFFGLAGPSMTVDTGQSSSLVAVHLAIESIRSGETTAAVAGGVHLNLADESTRALDRLGALSPDGRCHTFDARANGFARGEGGGLVVLKTLARAEADGDRVYGVLRGSAVNNDGPSAGLTVPRPDAQERVLRSACLRAGVAPHEVDYVELHGTGTAVGDPVEAQALAAAYGADRTLLVGSVKTNIGHLEGAAGVAGLIKALLALHHRCVPASLNFERPNPAIPLDRWRLRVVTEPTPWPEPGCAGVSSFGLGGTNAHVVVGPAPTPRPAAGHAGGPVAWVLAAHDEQALSDQAARLAAHLRPGFAAADVAHSLARTRAALPHRAVVVGTGDEMVTALTDLAEGLPTPAAVRGTARADTSGVVFVFPGQGSQWPGMATGLLDSSEAFTDALRECDDALRPLVGWSVVDVLRAVDGAPSMERTEVNQPVMWAVMVALAAVWRSCGVEPVAVVGQSQGEIAAACVAGALSIRDGARLIEARSRIAARELTGHGGMVWIGLPPADVRRRIARWRDRLSVAVVYGPESVVVAGEADALDELVAECEPHARVRRVAADYASHSALVERIEDPLKAELAELSPMTPRVPFYSTVTGGHTDVPLDADYWYRNLREPVDLLGAVDALLSDGRHTFVEVSPHPLLLAGIRDGAVARDTAVVTVPTLRRDEGGLARVLLSLGELHVRGVPVAWAELFRDAGRVSLPGYPFQRERYWIDDLPAAGATGPEPGGGNALVEGADAGADREAGDLPTVLRHAMAAVLGVRDPARIDLDASFRDLGFDSAMLVELAERLDPAVGRRLTSTTLFNHPTPARLAEHLTGGVGAAPPDLRTRDDDDPVVIVGIGCRFPGGIDSPESFWSALVGAEDLITDAPTDRGWPASGFRGGFLTDAAAFDAGFFGISPREALAMDPQQRLALETSWEALERAGIEPTSLRGTDTGVFLGLMPQDYGSRMGQASGETAGYVLTGVSPSVASGRLSYVLGLRGPALTVDTACSSSLVALHLAAQSLRSGECSLAIAGGVTVMATPGIFHEFARQGGLSADGRCRSFAHDADGTGWAEGAGVLVLERMSEARRQGREILAVVRGSAVNQDGASNGLTAPNGLAQEQVIRRALADAGLRPSEVDAVEAHGTGTVLGDPIEAEALIAAYGEGRDRPLLLGSVKSNIGHTQAAAGSAGLIKVVLAMRNRLLPRTLHADTPSERVDWATGAVRLLTEPESWEPNGRPLRAGVSSFGVSGTNAHVVVESAPVDAPAPVPPHGVLPLVVSGRTASAARQQALRLADHLDASGADLAPVASSLLTTRTLRAHRAVVLAADTAEAVTALRDLAPVAGHALNEAKTVFVFPGQGAQWVGMGRELWESQPVFAARMAECERALEPFVDFSLRDVVFEGRSLDRVDVVQPVTWAVMVSLAALWQAHGVRPDAVLGHSQGEIAAACVAGALTLDDAAKVVALRSRAIANGLAGRGGLLSVAVPVAEVPPDVEVAAVNGPRAVVLAGTPDRLDDLERDYRERGARVRRIPVDYASHSSQVDSIHDEVLASLAGIEARTPEIPWLSTVGAEWVGAPVPVDYWQRNLRGQVRFADAVRTLATAGYGLFVEVSPHPVLVDAVVDTAGSVAVCGSLRRDDGGWPRFLRSLAEHFVRGGAVDWRTVVPATSPAPLPTSVFERRHYWLGTADPVAPPTGADEPGGRVELGGLAGLGEHADSARLLDLVRAHAAAVLGDPDGIAADQAFRDAGFDSLTSLDLRTRLNAATGLVLPPTVAFDFPDPRRLAEHLREQLAGDVTRPAADVTPVDGDPIAIVGLAVRLPGGVTTPEAFWRLLDGGVDVVSDFPTDRGWDLEALYDPDPDSVGTTYTRRGGFLADAGAFDAGFFGISSREALAMDPQQRLLLEASWEALEDAGIDPTSLRDSQTGVFIGATPQPYGPSATAPDGAEGYLLTGGLPAVLSGRVSYVLGAQGPAVTVDTACSSSLVALHLAAQSLRLGESSMALAGGVTVMASPDVFVEFSRQRGLSVDGRCKSFSAGADGTGWSEGVGVVVLQRLSDALRDGRRVLAVVRGSAVNQDGASNGLTAPNGPAQEKVIRQALRSARLEPAEVDVVEAHGTGTTLGDPIEANALLATYGRDRDRPLWLGSVKSNVGHTQAAAGVVGVIKTVLALRHGVLPRTLHVDEPTDKVDWSAGAVELLTESVPWEENGRPRRAGVSSFGVSGTNAHVIIEEPPAQPAPEPVPPSDLVPVIVSGRTETALHAQAAAVAAHLDGTSTGLTEVAGSLVVARAAWEHRAVVLAGNDAEAASGLRDLTEAHVVTGKATGGGVGFVFPGQGAQHAGMGRELHDRFPVFRDAFDAVCVELDRHLDFSVRDAVFGDHGVLDGTAYAQTGLFAVEVAMAELAVSWGIRPRVLAGHSLGEITAALVAGVWSLADAARLVAARGRLMGALPEGGAMVSVPVAEDIARDLPDVSIAAVNGPTSVVLSGERAAVTRAVRALGVPGRELRVSHAFHSALMEPVLAEFGAIAAELEYHAPKIPLVSSVTGRLLTDDEARSPRYWTDQVRRTVRFADVVSTMTGDRARPVSTVLEVGPGGALSGLFTDVVAVPFTRRERPEVRTALTAAATLFTRGHDVDWRAVLPRTPVVAVPKTVFERRHYWLTGRRSAPDGPVGTDNMPVYAVHWVPVEPDGDVVHGTLVHDLPAGETPAWPALRVPGGDARAVVNDVLAVVREFVTQPRWEHSRLVVVTTGADTDPVAAAVWGLVRSAQSEHPDRLVLADIGSDADLPALWRAVPVADQFRVRAGEVRVPRLREVAVDGPPVWRPDATVLITGGTGTLGALVARHLVTEHGVGHVVLASRRGEDPALRAELTAAGAAVTMVACDVADHDQVRDLLRVAPITAVVHTAGVVEDGTLTSLDAAAVDAVFRPKVDAATHLDVLTRGMDLDAFVLFSSAAGVLGPAGQANYAAANAYLDALAVRRRAAGYPAVSLAWGHWAPVGGMTGRLGAVDTERLARLGVDRMTAEQGLRVLDHATAADRADLVPVRLAASAPRTGVLHDVVAAPTRTAGADRVGHDLPSLVRTVRAAAAAVLANTDVPETKAFRDAGFDSLTAIELRNRLAAATGLALPATVVFDHPNPTALAEFLHARLTTAATPAADTDPTTPSNATDDPIVVVGMAVRLPGGVATPEDYWRLLVDGVDAVSEFPTDRGWDLAGLYDPSPDSIGTSYTRHGGFLADAGLFDADFFGISPREALAMDPQQRLVLETSWEALERSGVDPTSLRGKEVGVFLGASAQSYGLAAGARSDGYLLLGNASSVLSGRVSYVLGVQGPAVTVDTACSSSLVSLHLAAQSLRSGECSMALAGGVTVMANPDVFVEFSRQRGLSPDGRCKPFAQAADGTAWSEGVGVLVVQRLSDALRDGREILAVVRGSAVNQDGASNGLTAPNGPAQEKVIRQALRVAGLRPADVDVVEAHGTGTTLGDPIEANALLATYGQDRDRPLWLGSVKSNIGHTQAAAGVVGVIKMVLALRHGVLPPTLHVDQPTDKVDWSTGSVRLTTESVPWTENGRPRRAGVSSFGVSGTNAHVILEQPPTRPEAPVDDTSPLVVSARSATGLAAQAARVADHPAGVARSLVVARPAWPWRAVALKPDALRDFAAGQPTPDVISGVATGSRKQALVFPGQGAQWVGMGRGLWESQPVFAARMEECERAFASYVDWSLRDVVFGAASLERVDVVQPVSFAVMVSLAALWRSYGFRPDAVIGHSQGEIAAACVSGALTLEDAARVVVLRSRVIASGLAGRGGMLSVEVAPGEVPEGVEIAAVNGPRSVVLAGEPDALSELAAGYAAKGVRARRIPVDYASHTSQVDAVAEEILERIGDVRGREPEIPWLSTVDVGWMGAVDASYWVRNLRQQVRFADAVAELGNEDFDLFVEAGSHPVLTAAIADSLPDAVVVGSLRRDDGGWDRFVRSLAEVFVRGGTVDWRAVVPDAPLVPVPTTEFDRQRYWLTADRSPGDVTGVGLDPVTHPVLGAAVEDPETGGVVLTGRLAHRLQPWLVDHAVAGAVVVPGAALAELVVQAGDRVGCPVVAELVLGQPLVLGPTEDVAVRVAVGPAEEDGRRSVSVHGRTGNGPWTRYATGTLDSHVDEPPGEVEWPPSGAEPVADCYAVLADAGYEYGPAFQGVRSLWRRGAELFAEVDLPEGVAPEGFAVHPALLDAVVQPTALLDPAALRDSGRIELPFAWQRLIVRAVGATSVRVRIRPGGEVTAVDATGSPVLTLGALASRPVAPRDLRPAADDLFRVDWAPLPSTAPVATPPGWVVFPVDPGSGSDAERARHAVAEVLAAVHRVLADDARLVVVTRNAVDPTGSGEVDPAAAAVWGLVRAAQVEHPGRLVLVDGDGAVESAAAAAVAADEWQVAVRGERCWVPRLARVAAAGTDPAWDTEGTVLITGGTGALGSLVARHLAAEHGVRRLVLASRQGDRAADAERLRVELGAEVVTCDVADRDQVRALLAEVAPTVVVHTAGVLDDGAITSLDADRLDGVFGPKVDAFGHLDEATRELGASLVVFSSAAGVLGNAGQGNYAAANAFLDAAVVRRRAAGHAGVSLAWGLWAKASAMTGHLDDGDRDRMTRAGVAAIDVERGMRMFDAALACGEPAVVPVVPDLPALRARARSGRVPAMWRDLVGPVRPAAAPRHADLRAELADLEVARRRAALTDLVRREAAVVLNRADAGGIGPLTAFRDLGFDSLTSVELRNRLGAATDVRLPVTVVFDHPNPTVLGERLHEGMFGRDEPAPEPVVEPDEESALIAEMDAESLIKRALGELG
ncbi:type I polyketide synthase [Saccharothrix obliqua]|uniref:type I polyketide synthase n=1 Tax=Saccharothrix obliqua TaxID=2861747 RepID=UPI001C5FC992|nr:type I polyketide synthase [Saccharothrix obliqua]MBW4722194.1 SDR family NAD(P)-dependent oxidoreductase [Saccharothrix obliqua]